MKASKEEDNTLKEAHKVRGAAYAPYSHFSVGAALLSESGKIYFGCNVENISFGLTMCAERVAVGSAIANGSRDLVFLALVSDSQTPVVPCGACRQVLAEFNPNLRIVSQNLQGKTAQFRLDELLPMPSQGILG